MDVSEAAGLGEPARLRVTVALPDPSTLAATPLVCFALPGGGYGRRYFTFDMPGSSGGGQAGWLAQRGWIFAAIDHLGTGESSLPDPRKLLYHNVSAASHAAVRTVLDRLTAGTLAPEFPAIPSSVALGIGHSMGGCLTVVQQARHNSYDGIAVLGFSAIHTRPYCLPGTPREPVPYVPRDAAPTELDLRSLENRRAKSINSALFALGARSAAVVLRQLLIPLPFRPQAAQEKIDGYLQAPTPLGAVPYDSERRKTRGRARHHRQEVLREYRGILGDDGPLVRMPLEQIDQQLIARRADQVSPAGDLRESQRMGSGDP